MKYLTVRRMSVVFVAATITFACSRNPQTQTLATYPQNEGQATSPPTSSPEQQLIACGTSVYNLPEAAILRPHFPFNLNDATIEQMTDIHLATDAEVKALEFIHPKLQVCRKNYLAAESKAAPSTVAVLTVYFN